MARPLDDAISTAFGTWHDSLQRTPFVDENGADFKVINVCAFVALNLLAFSSKKAAEIIKKVLESAVANAEHNEGADVDDLKVSTVFVNEGRSLKRIMPRAKGRADRIVKRSCHITVKVADK